MQFLPPGRRSVGTYGMTIEDLIRNIETRMQEIENRLIEQDLSPTGDDYNLLYDALLDELGAAKGAEK